MCPHSYGYIDLKPYHCMAGILKQHVGVHEYSRDLIS